MMPRGGSSPALRRWDMEAHVQGQHEAWCEEALGLSASL